MTETSGPGKGFSGAPHAPTADPSARAGTAVITGASRGIGAVYADRLARRGYDLMLIARSEGRLKELAAHVVDATGRTIAPLALNLNDKADLAVVERALRDDPSITMLVNNAGIGSVAPLLEADVEVMEAMIGVNVRALTRLTYAAAPAFVARSAGTIINIASIVGVSPETLNGVYGATKAYVIAFTQSLHHELAPKGIRIQAVLPSAIATDFWELSGRPYQELPSSIVMSPEDLVDAALVGLDRGEVFTLPSLQDGDEWDRFEATRRTLATGLHGSMPASRYRNTESASTSTSARER